VAGCKAIIHQHLDMTLTLMIAGHRIGHYSAEGKLLTPLSKKQIKAVEKTLRGKVQKQTFPPNLQIPHTRFGIMSRLTVIGPELGNLALLERLSIHPSTVCCTKAPNPFSLVCKYRRAASALYTAPLPSGYKSNKINWLLKLPKSFSEFDV
jgi:hypothetical protein